jgi:hypothetical protein
LEGDCLSPEAEAATLQTVVRLHVAGRPVGDLAAKIEHAKRSWAIQHADLPIVAAPMSLQRGEIAHAVISATAYQTASRTKSVRYGGPALSFRIARGVYYRTGGYKVHRQAEEYEKALGHGSLAVTNKRLIFLSPNGATAIRLDSILHIEPYTNAVELIRSSGKPTTYRFDQPDEWFCATLARAIHDATAG